MLHEWTRDAHDNPYRALLGLADYFVVTSDSVSMMVEVADCGKPLAIFSLPADLKGRLWQRILVRLHGRDRHGGPLQGLYRWLGKLLYASGVAGFARDLGELQQHLVDQGFAVWSGEPFKPATRSLPDELAAVANRIRALIGANAG